MFFCVPRKRFVDSVLLWRLNVVLDVRISDTTLQWDAVTRGPPIEKVRSLLCSL